MIVLISHDVLKQADNKENKNVKCLRRGDNTLITIEDELEKVEFVFPIKKDELEKKKNPMLKCSKLTVTEDSYRFSQRQENFSLDSTKYIYALLHSNCIKSEVFMHKSIVDTNRVCVLRTISYITNGLDNIRYLDKFYFVKIRMLDISTSMKFYLEPQNSTHLHKYIQISNTGLFIVVEEKYAKETIYAKNYIPLSTLSW